MEPRPIVVLRTPLTGGGEASPDFREVLSKEGYLVVLGNPEDIRVYAAQPYTADDVAFLRERRPSAMMVTAEEMARWNSIIDRMAAVYGD